MTRLSIGALSKQTDCAVSTIRYYEEVGLLPQPERAENGHRYYRASDLNRLVFIKCCRDFGFPIEQVRDLVKMFEEGGCQCIEVRELMRAHLDLVRAKIADMRDLESNLEAFISSCDSSCVGDSTARCGIFTDIFAGPSPKSAKAASWCRAAPSAIAKASFARELKGAKLAEADHRACWAVAGITRGA